MRLQSEPITSTHGLALLLKAARTLNDGDPLDVVLEEVASAAARSVWRPPGETGAATVWKLRGSELILEAEVGGWGRRRPCPEASGWRASSRKCWGRGGLCFSA